MRRIFLLLVCFLATANALMAVSFTAKDEDVFSGNVGFITVGNTNHKLKTVDLTSFPKDKDEEIGAIEAIKDGTVYTKLAAANVKNSNNALFMIATPAEATCDGELSIKKAYLSWGGRGKDSK
ncbi:MAG: hypothetical protein PUC42_07485 [Bacteroidales bacterium]|nr:hypothetical protein [Bacteroidales bacterium]